MTDPRTAREALILQSLGELDVVLRKADDVGQHLTNAAQRLEAAAATLGTAGSKYDAELTRLTAETKKALAEFIERRASATTADAMALHRRAMQEAATLAFAEQLAPAIRDITRQLEQHDRPHTLNLRPGLALVLGSMTLMAGVAMGAVATFVLR